MSKDLWKALSGVICVYKHSGISSTALKKLITNRISESVAEIESTSRLYLPSVSVPLIEPHETSGALVVVGRNELADYRHHHLVCGKSIRADDIQILDPLPLETNSSGVCVFGLNEGCNTIPSIMSKSWTNVYRIDGILGKYAGKRESEAESSVDVTKISKHRLEKIISRMESEFRTASFQYANVDMQSDEAFELARKGLPRAQLPGAQIIYSIEINFFKTPRFSITVHSSGEDDEMLRILVENIGSHLATTALTIRLQRQYFGPFSSEDALLEKQINLQNIVRNIQLNSKILESSSQSLDNRIVEERSKNLSEAEKRTREIFDGLGIRESTCSTEYDAMRPAWPRDY